MAVAWRQGASVRGSAGVGLRGRSAAARSSRGARASRARGAVAGAKVDPKDQWYAKGGEVANLRGVVSTPEFLQVLAENTDRLVVVDFYAKWCGACKALYPKILQLAERNPDVLFVKVDFDDNRKMSKSLGVKVLPYFHFYRGSAGRVAAFSASVSKVQRLRDAIAEHTAEDAASKAGEPMMPIPELEELQKAEEAEEKEGSAV